MEKLLKYIYVLALPDKSMDSSRLYQIIYASDKYNLAALKAWCVGILIRYHGGPERIKQLLLAHRHGLDQLKAVCIAQLSVDVSVSGRRFVLNILQSDLSAEVVQAAGKRLNEIKSIILV